MPQKARAPGEKSWTTGTKTSIGARYSCASVRGSSKSAGSTPRTVRGEPLTSSDWPTTFGSPPKACCQNAWLIITVSSGARPGSNFVPMAGSEPSVDKSSLSTISVSG